MNNIKKIFKGFSGRTHAVQIEGNSFVEELFSPLGYAVESSDIFSELFKFYTLTKSLKETNPKLPFWFSLDSLKNQIWVHKGFLTDYASIPRILWPLLAPRQIRRPAIFHDALYRALWWMFKHKLISKKVFTHFRKVFDDLFNESIHHTNPYINKFRHWFAYKTVRWFGGISWIAKKSDLDPRQKNKYNNHSNKPK